MAGDELGKELYRYLIDTYHNTEVRVGKCWVMSPEWWCEVRRMADANGRPIWSPPAPWDFPDQLLGMRVHVRLGAGAPQLVSETPGEWVPVRRYV